MYKTSDKVPFYNLRFGALQRVILNMQLNHSGLIFSIYYIDTFDRKCIPNKVLLISTEPESCN